MHVLPSNYTLIKDSIYCVQLFRIFFFFINFFKFCNVKCTVPNRNILTPKQTPKYDQGSPLCLVGVYFLKTNDLQLLQSAMGLLGVSSWGQLCALKCEADPIFFLVACKPAPCIFQTTYMCIYTICPLHIPNKHVEIYGHFSVAIKGLLLCLFWGHSRPEADPQKTLKAVLGFGLLFVRFGLVGTVSFINWKCQNISMCFCYNHRVIIFKND